MDDGIQLIKHHLLDHRLYTYGLLPHQKMEYPFNKNVNKRTPHVCHDKSSIKTHVGTFQIINTQLSKTFSEPPLRQKSKTHQSAKQQK